MEKIESFIVDKRVAALPFYVELAGITYPTANYDIQRECSEAYVLEYILGGTGTVEIDGKVFHPTQGDVYLLPKGSRHHYYAAKDDPFHKIWMNVDGELCRQLIQLYRLSGKYHFRGVDLSAQFFRFLQLCERREADFYDQCSLVFMEILLKLYHHAEAKPFVNEYAAQAKDFCDRNVYQKITVAEVSKQVGLSVSQLNRLFKQEYGCTVYAYILRNKISTAKTLLGGTSLSVGEIAYLLKFADEHYFTNIFKQKTQMTPTQFRAR